ncbi:MAG TPA: cupredoxin domain-containing protein [Actinomycetota bacterium]|nr:cupredoxin domain-containing protein [Actinomycetota bacterium]
MRKTMIALVVLLALGLAACSGRYKPDGTAGGAAAGTETGAQGETGATTADCVDQTGGDATISISGFAYDANCLTVSAANGITIVNEDRSAHSFSVEGGIVDETLEAGQTVTVKSLSDLEPGKTYAFNCRFHPPMTGSLVVE